MEFEILIYLINEMLEKLTTTFLRIVYLTNGHFQNMLH